jgi:hypothetical protein
LIAAFAAITALGVTAPAARADRYYGRHRSYGHDRYYRHDGDGGFLPGLVLGGALGYVLGNDRRRDHYDSRYYDRYDDRYYDRGYACDDPPRRVYRERYYVEEDYSYRPRYRSRSYYDRCD